MVGTILGIVYYQCTIEFYFGSGSLVAEPTTAA